MCVKSCVEWRAWMLSLVVSMYLKAKSLYTILQIVQSCHQEMDKTNFGTLYRKMSLILSKNSLVCMITLSSEFGPLFCPECTTQTISLLPVEIGRMKKQFYCVTFPSYEENIINRARSSENGNRQTFELQGRSIGPYKTEKGVIRAIRC